IWMPVMMQAEIRYSGNASMEDADGQKPWIAQDGIRWLAMLLRTSDAGQRAPVMERLSAVFHQEMQQRAAKQTDARTRDPLLHATLQAENGARGVSSLRRSFATPLWVLMSAVATILLIACANLANLLLARGR